jgi:hypothetical protein
VLAALPEHPIRAVMDLILFFLLSHLLAAVAQVEMAQEQGKLVDQVGVLAETQAHLQVVQERLIKVMQVAQAQRLLRLVLVVAAQGVLVAQTQV